MPEPLLEIYELNIMDFLQSFNSKKILYVVDQYSRKYISATTDYIIYCEETEYSLFDNICFDYVIAIGGCSCLDVAKVVSKQSEKPLLIVPTILSTSCISNDVSVIREEKESKYIRTVSPLKSIICLKHFKSQNNTILRHWSASGFGDLLANISAVIDTLSQNNNLHYEKIVTFSSVSWEAMSWVLKFGWDYSELNLIRLAKWIHKSSLDTIRYGHSNYNAGCEHDFYEKLYKTENYQASVQTHGIVVAIGTIITVALYEEILENETILEKLISVYQNIGLPTTIADLKELNMKPEKLNEIIFEVAKDNPMSFYGRYINILGKNPIEKIFGPK